jgi:hypothetical protein
MGGRAGNIALRRALCWDAETYWSIRNRLVDSGVLELGRGQGGAVRLVTQTPAQPGTIEDDLYTPVADVLKTQWAGDWRFTRVIVEDTARQGRRDTGGTWTRPDIVMAALRVFPHVPGKFFDLITFELKSGAAIDVKAVFEALSHRRAATQAYVWLHVPTGAESNADLSTRLERIKEEASRYGVGMIVGADPSDYSSWEFRLQAARFEPDPESMNEFIAQQLSALAHDELAQWFR